MVFLVGRQGQAVARVLPLHMLQRAPPAVEHLQQHEPLTVALGQIGTEAFARIRLQIQRPAATQGWFAVGILCQDRKSTRLNSSHLVISYAVFCLKKKKYRMT